MDGCLLYFVASAISIISIKFSIHVEHNLAEHIGYLPLVLLTQCKRNRGRKLVDYSCNYHRKKIWIHIYQNKIFRQISVTVVVEKSKNKNLKRYPRFILLSVSISKMFFINRIVIVLGLSWCRLRLKHVRHSRTIKLSVSAASKHDPKCFSCDVIDVKSSQTFFTLFR